MNSKKSSSRKTTSKRTTKSASRKPAKKSQGLFKKKAIKPKVKLDSDRVIKLCIIIIIACILLLLATVLIPDGTLNKDSSQRKTDIERTVNPGEENSTNKNSAEKKSSKKDSKKRDEEKRRAEEQKKIDEEKRRAEEQKKQEELKREKEKQDAEAKAAEEKKRKEELKKEEEKKAAEAKAKEFNFAPAVNKAQVVFLLDDGGQNISQLDKFLSLDMPLTVAVLPGLAHSKEAGQKVRAAKKELILHQPMQAINTSVNPGPGAIKPDMTESEIKSILFQNISEVGPVSGMNNHEGSLITADAEKMEVILKFASDNGMYFLDSRTNKDTKVGYVSGALGLSYYERNGLFLDNEKTRENALTEIKKNLEKANKDGYVIMIGHVWSASFLPDLLRDIYPELKKKGYVVTTVSNCRGKK